MNPEIEKLIKMALVDGQITDKEREIILRKAEKLGLDVDEVEMYLEGSLDHNKSHNTSIIIEDTAVNLESKPLISEIANTRNFTPKIVKPIEPALLNREEELKLKISELSDSKKVLFDNLENLYNNLKIPNDYLVSQKIIVDKQLSILVDEYAKSSKVYLDKFINEINISVSDKFGATALIIDNPEKLIGLNSTKIITLIKDEGTWDIKSLNNKYEKNRLLFKILSWTGFIFTLIMGNLRHANEWGIGIGIFTCMISGQISYNYSKLIKKNKMNFNVEDLNPIINGIFLKFENEFDELLTLKNQINSLKILLKKLELKDISIKKK